MVPCSSGRVDRRPRLPQDRPSSTPGPTPCSRPIRPRGITYANPQVERTFGYAPGELIGEPLATLLPPQAGNGHAAHLEALLGDPVARAMGTGLELVGRRRDGTEFPVEIGLAPVSGPDGLQVFATIVDITTRREAQDAVAASERRLREVLEASPNAIVAIDESAYLTYVNPQTERTFGYPAAELLGQRIELLLPERLDATHVEHRTSYIAIPWPGPWASDSISPDAARTGRSSRSRSACRRSADQPGSRSSPRSSTSPLARSRENQLLQAQKLEIDRAARGRHRP